MLELSFAKPFHVEILREVKGIKADIADVSLQALRVCKEGNGFGHFSVKLSGDSSRL
jgi:hypothetical protein